MSAIRHIMTVLTLVVALTGCEEGEAGASSDDASLNVIVSPQQAQCERTGGRWGAVPNTVTSTCFRMTRDANQPCATARDCDGLCLARSRTCAPQTPLFGCHEILSANGSRQTLCTE
ncbi:MAG: hypothetical protein AAF222_05725 [Pseudomonadota bacterium]